METKVFISYSWDGEEHQEWVEQLATKLEEEELEITFDKKLNYGENLETFMDSITTYDAIVVIITKNYTSRANNFEGGVGKEIKYMENFNGKIIPLLCEGDWEEVPKILKDKKGIDMRKKNDMNLFPNYSELLKALKLTLTFNFSQRLNDIGPIENNHPYKEKIFLDDIYVYPELKIFDEVEEETTKLKNSNKINSFKIIEQLIKGDKIIIYGEPQSGRTSLCYKIFKELLDSGENPIFLGNNKIKNLDTSIKEFYKVAYDIKEKVSKESYKNSILIVDDFYENVKKNKYILEEMLSFKGLLIIVDDKIFLETLFNHYSEIKKYSILEYSPKLRNELICNWINLREEEGYDKLCKIDGKKELVDRTLGKAFSSGFMPSYPFFILSILSISDTMKSSLENGITSQGHCYSLLIQVSLMKSGIKEEELDSYQNILTILSFFMYTKNTYEINSDEMEEFLKNYKNEYITLEEKNEIIINNLRKSKLILKNSIGGFTFQYKYLYYYFLGKYFSLNYDENQENISNILANLHLEKNTYICIFLSHHYNDVKFINELEKNAKQLFQEFKEATLDKNELSFFSDALLIDDFLPLAENNAVVEKNREKLLEMQEEIENNNSETEENISEENELDDDENFKQFRKAIKTIEVIGGIVRNRYGSMKKNYQEKVIKEGIGINLRILSYLLSSIQNVDNNEELILFIKERLEYFCKKKGITDKINFREEAQKIFWKINEFFIFAIIFKTVKAIGSESLKGVLSTLIEDKDNKTPAYSLIKHGVNIFYCNTIEPIQIKNDFKFFNYSKVAELIVKQMIVDYSQFHYLDYRDKQRIKSILDL